MYFAGMGHPSYLIFDEKQVFLSRFIEHIYKRLGIKIKTITQYNNALLKTERHIRTIHDCK